MSSIPTTPSPAKQPPVISPNDGEGHVVGSQLVSIEDMKINHPGGDDVVVLCGDGNNTPGYMTSFDGIIEAALGPVQEALAAERRDRIAELAEERRDRIAGDAEERRDRIAEFAEERRDRIAEFAAAAIRIQTLEDRIFEQDFLLNQAQDVLDERQGAVDANL
jgi:hypothetical protein